MAFLSELKRRRVGKVAIAYGAIAWGVTEASSVVFPALHVPEWAMTFVVVFLMAGFPVAMVLAWIFDVGPEGIQRTEPLPQSPPSAQVRLRMAYAFVVLACMAGLGYLLYERGLGRAHAGEPHSSIAVMPFTNLSGDPSKEYFSDGMSEELLNLLARVPGLQVAARTSSFAYKNKGVDVRQIGKDLGVEAVLEGSVRQAGDQVRITAQLIDTDTGFHLWSETYDRRMADIFQVQDEIAQAIVDKLRIQLAPEQQQVAQRQKAPTQNVEAYELYLQGRAIWKRRGEENLKRAIELYQAAIGRDPGFARAHAALASAYVVLPGYTKEMGDEEKFFALAENSARQALAIDPNIGEAHAVLAQINAERGDLLDAESGFFFAISLEPNEPTPHQWYSILLMKVGRLDAALSQAKRAQELDPTSPILAANLANAYLTKGDNDAALRYSKLASELGLGRRGFGVETLVAIRRGQWDEAARLIGEEHELPQELRSKAPEFVAALANPAKRPDIVNYLRRLDPKISPQSQLIGTYLDLGETDLAYRVMFETLDKDHLAWARDWDLAMAWSLEGAAMRRDPRFGELAERIGMVDYWKQYGFPDGCHAGTDSAIVCS
ncbi:MAG: tetratricopeptide repeat protein [Gammaproteobacteria bacterium]|nr:tetratricopeptide repeat protein [Gammaproteobacteria bacterium]